MRTYMACANHCAVNLVSDMQCNVNGPPCTSSATCARRTRVCCSRRGHVVTSPTNAGSKDHTLLVAGPFTLSVAHSLALAVEAVPLPVLCDFTRDLRLDPQQNSHIVKPANPRDAVWNEVEWIHHVPHGSQYLEPSRLVNAVLAFPVHVEHLDQRDKHLAGFSTFVSSASPHLVSENPGLGKVELHALQVFAFKLLCFHLRICHLLRVLGFIRIRPFAFRFAHGC